MGLTSLQVCMDSSDWFQGAMHEDESGMDSSSPSAGGGNGGVDMDMLTCARPNMIERRLRPPHDQALKCPRCDSTHTKFCYYNNYSLSQPRYFCKTCRRYWTKGGTLRNIPVGGGCRKNKKVSSSSSKKPSSASTSADHSPIGTPHNPTDLHLSFPADVQYSHLSGLLGTHHQLSNVNHSNFMEAKYNAMLNENNNINITAARPIDFMMESKLEAIVGHSSSRNNNYDFMAGGDHMASFNSLCSPFGMGMEHHLNNNNNNINLGGSTASFADSCGQRLMLPYEDHQNIAMDVKPKLLSLEWQDHHQQQQPQQQGGCTDTTKDSFGYLGSWSGMINGYGSSATNPLV